MTARNQPHKYRCETCNHFQTRFEYGNKKICMKIRKKFSNSYQIGLPLYTEIVGCYSHSDAGKAEQRIKDVIQNLERLDAEAAKLDYRDYPRSVLSRSLTYGEAITLLRGKEE